MKIRLNKYLASTGNTSRRKADELIQSGRVMVNSRVTLDLGSQVDDEKDDVYLDGELLKPSKKVYYILNKPRGFVTTTSDEKRRPVVTELVPKVPPVFPVGRLDVNTTGVLILTNDGEFSNALIHPSHGCQRVYLAKIDKAISEEHRLRLERGVRLDNRQSRFEEIAAVNKSDMLLRVSTREGRNHFVKRLFGTLGYTVTALHRESIGKFTVEGIPPGSYKKISPDLAQRFLLKDE